MTSGIFDVQFVETPTNERTNRGYIYKKKTQYFFKCHNCSAGHTFNNFLKSIDALLHKEYVLEKYQSGQTRGNTPIPDKVPFQFETEV